MKLIVPVLPLALLSAIAASPPGQGQRLPPELLLTSFEPSAASSDAANSRGIALGDLDGDGDIDIVVANTLGEDNALYWNDGAGRFRAETASPLSSDGGFSRDVALGDIDGDEDLDVFVTNNPANPNFLYVNQGGLQGGTQGEFARRTDGAIASENANSRGASFADIDADGDLDLFVTNGSNNDNSMYVNQGGVQGGAQGDFVRRTSGDEVSDGGISHRACFADVDADGDLDLFVPNHGGVMGAGAGAPNFYYLNDGDGNFERVREGPIATDRANSLCAAFGDVDDDGDLDLFVGNNQGQNNSVYENDGSGSFSPLSARSLTIDRGETTACAWGDVDRDGDDDLLAVNRTTLLGPRPTAGTFNTLYLNLGSADFSLPDHGPLATDADESYGAALGDLDGDGRLDLAVANLGQPNALYRNLGRQWVDLGHGLAGDGGQPTLGAAGNLRPLSPVRLRVEHAPADAPASLVIGLDERHAAFKGGTLVPAPHAVIPCRGTSRTGVLELDGHLPAGMPAHSLLFLQVWIHDPLGPHDFAASNALQARLP